MNHKSFKGSFRAQGFASAELVFLCELVAQDLLHLNSVNKPCGPASVKVAGNAEEDLPEGSPSDFSRSFPRVPSHSS